jgi:hypothetical protein
LSFAITRCVHVRPPGGRALPRLARDDRGVHEADLFQPLPHTRLDEAGLELKKLRAGSPENAR